ncbi:MAG TPA: branched-chain amino acid ABC transporter permease [Hyphomicrobiales bacterium]|nr:branched-chain amino acid ABC transporter permease [Hyphomicrobiales bacterium]
MAGFAHQLLSGIVSGSTYAALALALVMIYRATNLVNFAQGEMAMFSTYVAWTLLSMGFPYWLAFPITIVLSFALGVGLEYAIVRPISSRSALDVVVVFIGLLMIFNSLAGWLWTTTIKTFPSPFPATMIPKNTYISAHEVGLLIVTFVLLSGLYVLLQFTRLGLAMRAVAQNRESSMLVGIRVGRMLALGWGIAAAIGAVAGIMVAPILYLDPNMMLGVIIYGFAGALVGGIDNPWGAVAGGLLVGVLENLLGTYVIGTEVKLSVALVVIIGVLVVKPSGLFGRTAVTRV